MSGKIGDILLTALAALMLFGLALAVPSGTLTQGAHQRYVNEDEFFFEDEGDFFFEDEDEFVFEDEDEFFVVEE